MQHRQALQALPGLRNKARMFQHQTGAGRELRHHPHLILAKCRQFRALQIQRADDPFPVIQRQDQFRTRRGPALHVIGIRPNVRHVDELPGTDRLRDQSQPVHGQRAQEDLGRGGACNRQSLQGGGFPIRNKKPQTAIGLPKFRHHNPGDLLTQFGDIRRDGPDQRVGRPVQAIQFLVALLDGFEQAGVIDCARRLACEQGKQA